MEIATTTMASPPEALIKFCLLWSVLQRSEPPEVCDSVFSMEEFADAHDLQTVFSNHGLLKRLQIHDANPESANDFLNVDNSKDSSNENNAFQFHFKHTSRSLSVIGVLGGIVLILFFVALSTCIKHRRNLYASADRYQHRETLAREMLVDHLRQLRSHASRGRNNQADRPPTYDEVTKPSTSTENEDSEVDPPSYLEATTACSSQPTQLSNNEDEALDVTESTTVVTVEVPRPSSSSSC